MHGGRIFSLPVLRGGLTDTWGQGPIAKKIIDFHDDTYFIKRFLVFFFNKRSYDTQHENVIQGAMAEMFHVRAKVTFSSGQRPCACP